MNIKKGDTVVVIAGKDNGKKGKVLEVSPKTNRVVVEDVNVLAKHKKPRSAQDKGGIIKSEHPIDASNVMVVCSACGKATRVAHKIIDGEKARVCKKCGASLDKDMKKQVKKDVKAETKAAKAETTKAEKSAKTEQKSKSSTAAKKPAAKNAENKD